MSTVALEPPVREAGTARRAAVALVAGEPSHQRTRTRTLRDGTQHRLHPLRLRAAHPRHRPPRDSPFWDRCHSPWRRRRAHRALRRVPDHRPTRDHHRHHPRRRRGLRIPDRDRRHLRLGLAVPSRPQLALLLEGNRHPGRGHRCRVPPLPSWASRYVRRSEADTERPRDGGWQEGVARGQVTGVRSLVAISDAMPGRVIVSLLVIGEVELAPDAIAWAMFG